jgi:hypothetical protein
MKMIHKKDSFVCLSAGINRESLIRKIDGLDEEL